MSNEDEDQENTTFGPVRMIMLNSGKNVLGMVQQAEALSMQCLIVTCPATMRTVPVDAVEALVSSEDDIEEDAEQYATIMVQYQPYSHDNVVFLPLHAIESITAVNQSLMKDYIKWVEGLYSEHGEGEIEDENGGGSGNGEQIDDTVPDDATFH